jgi:thioredoxin 1
MDSVVTILGAGILGLVVLAFGLQIFIRLRAHGLRGKPAPEVSGVLGQRIAQGKPALVYFHSPGCAACRRWTPRLEQLSRKNAGVHVVDVSRNVEMARAFGVLATPSSVEVDDGRIVDCHIGPVPSELLARFA